MTDVILKDLSTLINQRLNNYEVLSMYLAQGKALMELAVTAGFLEQQDITQHDYLWACRELLTQAYDLNEQLLAEWLDTIALNNLKTN